MPTRPSLTYQTSVPSSTTRTTPDVAWDANPSTGVAVYDSVGTGSSPWQVVGGTSVGAPSWSGLIAITDQGLALAGQGSLTNAQLSSALYSSSFSSNFNDIVTGNSGKNSAGPGYDLVTGLGSPKANLLIPALVATNSAGAAAVSSTVTHYPRCGSGLAARPRPDHAPFVNDQRECEQLFDQLDIILEHVDHTVDPDHPGDILVQRSCGDRGDRGAPACSSRISARAPRR